MDEKEFWKAVKTGDSPTVRAMLAEHPELAHIRDKERSTPLHLAAWRGHPEVIDLLISAGADLTAHTENNHWGTTALHAAAHGNHAPAVASLLRHGADVNAKKANGTGTPLGETKVHNAIAAAKLLRAAGGTE